MSALAAAEHRSTGAFSHEAVLYAGPEGFLDGTLPFIREGVAAGQPTLVMVGPGAAAAPFDAPLPAPATRPRTLAFRAGTLDAVRQFISQHAAEAGLGTGRAADLVLAVNELATNSLLHGGGEGELLFWSDED